MGWIRFHSFAALGANYHAYISMATAKVMGFLGCVTENLSKMTVGSVMTR